MQKLFFWQWSPFQIKPEVYPSTLILIPYILKEMYLLLWISHYLILNFKFHIQNVTFQNNISNVFFFRKVPFLIVHKGTRDQILFHEQGTK